MQRGGRGFEAPMRGLLPDVPGWRGAQRWPFIALCVLLSLGVIASGNPPRPGDAAATAAPATLPEQRVPPSVLDQSHPAQPASRAGDAWDTFSSSWREPQVRQTAGRGNDQVAR